MFSIFKKKQTPPATFAVLGADMHCHLVPQVDDGSKSLEETLSCLQTLAQVGYDRLYITPHFQFPRYPNKEDVITRRFEELKAEVENRGIPIQLAGIGGEYRIDDSFRTRLEKGTFLKVKDKVLVELSLHQLRLGVEETLFDLGMDDNEVILAHPERYPYYNVHSQTLSVLKEQGVYFQVNVLSLIGFYGTQAQRNALDFIKQGWVEYLGTDMHNTIYARALLDAAQNRTVRKILDENKFLNSEL